MTTNEVPRERFRCSACPGQPIIEGDGSDRDAHELVRHSGHNVTRRAEPATTSQPTITVERSKLYPVVARPGPEWRWTYDYQLSDEPGLRQYGTGLASLRDLLKRKYPTHRVIETWKASS